MNYHSSDPASRDIRAIQHAGFDVIGGNAEGIAAFDRAATPEPVQYGPALPKVRITNTATEFVVDTDAAEAAKRLAASIIEPRLAEARRRRQQWRRRVLEAEFNDLRLEFLAEFLLGASFYRAPVEYANLELGTWPR